MAWNNKLKRMTSAIVTALAIVVILFVVIVSDVGLPGTPVKTSQQAQQIAIQYVVKEYGQKYEDDKIVVTDPDWRFMVHSWFGCYYKLHYLHMGSEWHIYESFSCRG